MTVALDAEGNYLGEDAIVLNNPSGQIGVQILLAPESSITNGRRAITVATTTGKKEVHQVSLHLDAEMIARWATCPCVIEVPVAKLQGAAILSAEVGRTAAARLGRRSRSSASPGPMMASVTSTATTCRPATPAANGPGGL